MNYEFGKTTWFEENSDREVLQQDIEKLHEQTEDKIRESIKTLLDSQENFLGKGMTAEVHFLDSDRKLCYKIIRKVDVMARPDSIENIPLKYQSAYDKKILDKEKTKKTEPLITPWHIDLFTEATYLSRARSVDPDSPVKIPKPRARMEIKGKEEGEGYEISDDLEVLLMETMDAISIDDFMRDRKILPKGFDVDNFCKQVQKFIDAMHEKNLYHRDLHAGNIMIENGTGNPVIIDFGRSTVSAAEDAYKEYIKPGDTIQFISDELMFFDKVKGPLTQYAEYKKIDTI